jgi:hypothetical protein
MANPKKDMNDRAIPRAQAFAAKYAHWRRPLLSSQYRKGGLAFSPHIRQTSSATTVDDRRTNLAMGRSAKYAS